MASLNLFGVWDYVVVVLVLLISCAIGVYYRLTGGRQSTVKEYLLADKNMSILPVAISLMASFMSAITLLGVSSENYTFGAQFIVINFSYLIFTPVAAYFYIPVFFQLQAVSAYEYLERRFGKISRLAASLAYSLQIILYMGVVLYAPALTLEALTGISQVAAILSVGLVCTFYSTVGGMKAVLVTDVFQSLLMFAAVFSVIICALVDTGSFAEIWRIAEEGNRTSLLNFDPDPTVRHTWFTLILGGGVTFLSLFGVNQIQIQRYLTVKSLKRAQTALWWNLPVLSALSLTTSFSGLAIYSKYYKCDPVESKAISLSDQLMPFYVVDSMGHLPGLSGLFVAGIFSAALSTVSAAVNSLAAVTLEDYLKPLYLLIKGRPLPDVGITYRTKLIACTYGIVCIAVAFAAQFLGGVLQSALTIFGVIGGPLLGLFTLGMFTTTANQKGSMTGFIIALALCLWIAFGGPKPPLQKLPVRTDGCDDTFRLIKFNPQDLILMNLTASARSNPEPIDESNYFWLYRVSYFYNGVIGLLTTCIIGYSVSLFINIITKSKPKIWDPNLFTPILANRLRKQNTKLTPEFSEHSDNTNGK